MQEYHEEAEAEQLAMMTIITKDAFQHINRSEAERAGHSGYGAALRLFMRIVKSPWLRLRPIDDVVVA